MERKVYCVKYQSHCSLMLPPNNVNGGVTRNSEAIEARCMVLKGREDEKKQRGEQEEISTQIFAHCLHDKATLASNNTEKSSEERAK